MSQIKSGADIEHADQRGRSPFLFAVHEGRLRVAKALVDAGSIPDIL